MVLLVNGAERHLAASSTVADLVAQLGCGVRGVAVAVDGDVVPRSRWEQHRLQDHDRVEVLRAAAGG